jgi:UTP--glucose-1-phosphate uridylyltransferase
MTADQVAAAAEKMREGGQSNAAISQFSYALESVLSGAQTLIGSSELEPAPDVPSLETLPDVDAASVLERLVVIKLNGGLATSMGLQQRAMARASSRSSSARHSRCAAATACACR